MLDEISLPEEKVVPQVAVSLSFLILGLSPMMAQFEPEVSFCPAGVQADGFIDWTKLPTAPTSGALMPRFRFREFLDFPQRSRFRRAFPTQARRTIYGKQSE
jgi:hypothetical protein